MFGRDNVMELPDVIAAATYFDDAVAITRRIKVPSAEQGLDALVRKPTAGTIPPNWKPYLDKLPNDPWGKPYQYANPGLKGEIDVFSFGADGVLGGEGKDAEIGSWQ